MNPQGLSILLLAFFAFLSSSAFGPRGMYVQLASDKSEYAVGEPIQLRAFLINTSSGTIRVPHIDMLDRIYMRFMYYEITGPTGKAERLKSVRIHETMFLGDGYEGAPLASGDTIQVFLYPNVVNVSTTSDGQDEWISPKYAFPAAGAYKVNVVYAAWPKLFNLYQGVWRSNEITLRLRNPLSPEKKILDAMWHCMPEGESGIDWVVRDLDRIESLIETDPNDPLIAHARLALARGYYQLALRGDKSRATDAAEILDALGRQHPSFRREEVQRMLGRAYLASGEREKGTDTLMRLMAHDPLLWSTPEFVEAVTIIGIRDFSVSTQWRKRESLIGAKPMTREEFLTTFQDDRESRAR